MDKHRFDNAGGGNHPEPKAGASVRKTCGASFASHIRQLAFGFQVAGVGGGCEDTYRAVMEVAEEIRRSNDYAPYTPKLTSADIVMLLRDDDEPAPMTIDSTGTIRSNATEDDGA